MTDHNDLRARSPQQALQMAVRSHQAGDLKEAEQLYRRVLEDIPDQADALNLLGVIAQQHGDLDKALALFDQAIAAAPNLATIPFNKANALKEAGRNDEAIALYKTALDIEPDYADARLNLGALLHDRGDTQAAVAQFNLLLKGAPDHARAYYNLGKCRQTQGRLEDAQTALAKAIELDPNDPDAHFAQANVLADMGRLHDAIKHIDNAIKIKPGWGEAYTNRGNYLCDLDQQNLALTSYDTAISIDPASDSAQANKAFALLALGDLPNGWPHYRHRPTATLIQQNNRWNSIPTWDEEDLSEKTVLVIGEQGIGDEILFASTLKEFAAKADACTLVCSKKLVPVLRHSFEDVPNLSFTCLNEDGDLGHHFDYKTTIIDVCAKLRPSLAAFPIPQAYLKPASDRQEEIRLRYQSLFGENTPLVGISWSSGNPTIGAQKTVPIETWTPILDYPGVQFINLQSGQNHGDLSSAPRRLRDRLFSDSALDITNDLSEALSQMAALDLIITSSNTVAHLAGASGKETRVLLPNGRARLWYWFKGKNPCPWYPKVKLFQKPVGLSWLPVVTQITDELRAGLWHSIKKRRFPPN